MPDTEKHLLKVFLCHAKEDKPAVRDLYSRLAAEGWSEPWLDEKKLLPGQDWRTHIEEAVDTADVVVICLSCKSVNKEGFVQKELRYAREIALEKPEDTVFLIPLRLEECEVPRGLRFFQWVNYFGEQKEQSYFDLLASLKLRYEQILKHEAEEKARREKDEQARKEAEDIKRREAEKRIRQKVLTPAQSMLPDYRVRQRDYLLEIARMLTQELDLEKLLERALRVAIEMLAGQAGLITLKEPEGWRVAAAHRIQPEFLSYLEPLLGEEKVRELDVNELNRMLKELTYTATLGLLNGTGLPLNAHGQIIGVIFIFRNYPDLFTPNDRVLLQLFADQAAIAIFNARLYGQALKKAGDGHSENNDKNPN